MISVRIRSVFIPNLHVREREANNANCNCKANTVHDAPRRCRCAVGGCLVGVGRREAATQEHYIARSRSRVSDVRLLASNWQIAYVLAHEFDRICLHLYLFTGDFSFLSLPSASISGCFQLHAWCFFFCVCS